MQANMADVLEPKLTPSWEPPIPVAADGGVQTLAQMLAARGFLKYQPSDGD